MMDRSIFADTGYWIALNINSDDLHTVAVNLTRQYVGSEIITSQMVLTEFLNDLGSRTEQTRIAASQFVRKLSRQSNIVVVPQSDELFDEALGLFESRPDKGWSMTDCASFAICKRQGITEALAYDKHFEQAGIRPLMRQSKLG